MLIKREDTLDNVGRTISTFWADGHRHKFRVSPEIVYVDNGDGDGERVNGARVDRINCIGQGWNIGCYERIEDAERIARFLATVDQV